MARGMVFDLTGKVAIVTGAAQGIGRELALSLARAGADMVIADLNLKKAEEVKEEIIKEGRKSIAIKMDVTKADEVQRMVDETIKQFGKIDILVNNAGVMANGQPIEDISLEEWDRVLNINLKGVFLCSQRVGREMIKRRSGKIINISSIAGIVMAKGHPKTTYCTAKAGVNMLTEAMAVEWGKYNINVNTIAPGYTKTPAVQKSLDDPKLVNYRIEHTPLSRIGEPRDLGGAVVFLASPAADFITGHTLVVDGGYIASV